MYHLLLDRLVAEELEELKRAMAASASAASPTVATPSPNKSQKVLLPKMNRIYSFKM